MSNSMYYPKPGTVIGQEKAAGKCAYRIITKEDKELVAQMAAFVEGHQNSHFLQMPQWAGVKDAWRWRGILAYQDDTVIGALSVLIRPMPLHMCIMYAPRGPVCDRNDPMVLSLLQEGAKTLAKDQGALLLMMDTDEPDTNEGFRQIMQKLGYEESADEGFDNIQAQYVFRLPLKGKTEEQVLAEFASKHRYNIRVAQRKGVTIRRHLGTEQIPEEELDAFTAIMMETGERDHFIPRGKEYYKRVFANLGDDAVMFMAYLDETPIAGTIGVFSGRKGWYLYGASSNAHRNVMPNYLLQWEMIRCTMSRGESDFYDFRGVPGILTEDNPLYGLYRFKKGFSGDYIKFTGLFVHKFHPLLADGFQFALKTFRKVRAMTMIKK